MSFLAGFYMIQLNRIEPPYSEDKLPIFAYTDTDGSIFWQGFISMYYLVLGDFGDINLKRSYTDYAESERMWIQFENLLSHLYFLGATFITQIMIFNMLISIMSDT